MAISSIGVVAPTMANFCLDPVDQLGRVSRLFDSFGGGSNFARPCVEGLLPLFGAYNPFLRNCDPWSWSPASPGCKLEIGRFTSPEQDAKAQGALGRLYEKALSDGKQNLANNPKDSAVRDQLFASNNQRAEQLRKQGTPVSEEQVLIWHAESLIGAAREGRISSSTGTAAQDFLSAAHAKRQADVDVILKSGGSVAGELARYQPTSKFFLSSLIPQ